MRQVGMRYKRKDVDSLSPNLLIQSYEIHKMFDNGLFGFFYDENGKLRIRFSLSY
ncbi:hypothetical protein [Helicobacter aurati]|uniref:hypothetical protein n=1 Tax=Helicobacter aurati TaxID=137778 RepID=UPI00131565A0|nr:hypothetical protein [Helicobacter aurati]